MLIFTKCQALMNPPLTMQIAIIRIVEFGKGDPAMKKGDWYKDEHGNVYVVWCTGEAKWPWRVGIVVPSETASLDDFEDWLISQHMQRKP